MSLHQATVIEGSNETLWMLLGFANLLSGQATASLSAFDAALRLTPNSPDAWLGRGQALESLGRYAEALSAYEQVLAMNPSDRVAQDRRDAVELLV